jgi:hypothetical protein
MLSNNTLHSSPAIAIASFHFSLLTRTGSCFLSLGSLVSPHPRSAVHCIQNHHLLSRTPVRRCIPPFSNYRSSQARGHPSISALLTSQSAKQARICSSHLVAKSRCRPTGPTLLRVVLFFALPKASETADTLDSLFRDDHPISAPRRGYTSSLAL